MRLTVKEITLNEGRLVAFWDLPNIIESYAVAFTQLATPDSLRVATYQITLAPHDVDPEVPLCGVRLMERGAFPAECHRDQGHTGLHRAFVVGGTGPGYWHDGDTETRTAEPRV